MNKKHRTKRKKNEIAAKEYFHIKHSEPSLKKQASSAAKAAGRLFLPLFYFLSAPKMKTPDPHVAKLPQIF